MRIKTHKAFLIFFILISGYIYGLSPDVSNLDKVMAFLEGSSIAYEIRSLYTDYGSFGVSLLVRSPGKGQEASASQGTFVFAVPLYADFAVNTALSLVKVLEESINDGAKRPNTIVAFLGDERNSLHNEYGGSENTGLRDLLSLADTPENWALCYFDAEDIPDEIVIRHGIRGFVAPLAMIKNLPRLLESGNIPWSFRIRYNEIYKLGLVEGALPIFIAFEEGINSFVLSGKKNEKNILTGGEPRFGSAAPSGLLNLHTRQVMPDSLAEILFEYQATLNFPILDAERHYSIYRFPGGKVFFMGENLILFLLIGVMGISLFLFLIYSIVYNAILIFHIKLFFKNVWIFLILLPLLAFCIKASGLLYSLLLKNYGPPVPDLSSASLNYIGAGLTILLAIFVFFLHSPVLDLIQFPRRARFYGSSSVIFIIVGMLFAAFLDFSYIPVFIWAFFFIVLGASISNPLVVILCALLAPLSALGALINILQTGSIRIAELFISPFYNTFKNWIPPLQASFLSLPLFLLIKRGAILFQKNKNRGLEIKPIRKKRLISLSFLSVIILFLMIVQIQNVPENKNNPIRRNIDAGNDGEILLLSYDDISFQDSRIITLRLSAIESPKRFLIYLESKNDETLLPVYSSSVPYERENEGKKISLTLGENPPNPLLMEIVVPEDFEGFLNAEAIYDYWSSVIDTAEEPGNEDYIMKVYKRVEL